ncbi:hypothetical protein BT96DRAFT_919598 [Gymnopus androsaceus JB14]|uniref:Uncharacterized protein n=1 Tax=Gymnopus androsaceus JB14 TaxID=1447944 RepID=A0A6A4HR14_9AGAR|nr:hypothetical protein BT96DRAFT_919598 [Gymnopus androsaceus JB14]
MTIAPTSGSASSTRVWDECVDRDGDLAFKTKDGVQCQITSSRLIGNERSQHIDLGNLRERLAEQKYENVLVLYRFFYAGTSPLSDFRFLEWKALFGISVVCSLEYPREVAAKQLRKDSSCPPIDVLELRKLYDTYLSLQWATPKLQELAIRSNSLSWVEAKKLSIVDLTLLLQAREEYSSMKTQAHLYSMPYDRPSDILSAAIRNYTIRSLLNTHFSFLTQFIMRCPLFFPAMFLSDIALQLLGYNSCSPLKTAQFIPSLPASENYLLHAANPFQIWFLKIENTIFKVYKRDFDGSPLFDGYRLIGDANSFEHPIEQMPEIRLNDFKNLMHYFSKPHTYDRKDKEQRYSSILRVSKIYSLEECFKDVAKKARRTQFRNPMDKLRIHAEFENPTESYVEEAIPIDWAEDALISLSDIQRRTRPLSVTEVKEIGERMAWVIGTVRENAWEYAFSQVNGHYNRRVYRDITDVGDVEFYVRNVRKRLGEIRHGV